MKLIYIIYILAIAVLTLPSCRVMYPPTAPAHNDPYIELKTGVKFSGGLLKGNIPQEENRRVRLGDTSFANRDVAFYSTGQKNYANVGKPLFAPQVAMGRINMYKYSAYRIGHDTSVHVPGMFSSLNNERYYIQNGDKGPLETLEYSNLRDMITPGTPEYKLMEHYRKTKNVSNVLLGATFGLEIAAIASLFNNDPYAAPHNSQAANVYFPLSFLALLTADIVLLRGNYNRLLRAVFASGSSPLRQDQ